MQILPSVAVTKHRPFECLTDLLWIDLRGTCGGYLVRRGRLPPSGRQDRSGCWFKV